MKAFENIVIRDFNYSDIYWKSSLGKKVKFFTLLADHSIFQEMEEAKKSQLFYNLDHANKDKLVSKLELVRILGDCNHGFS